MRRRVSRFLGAIVLSAMVCPATAFAHEHGGGGHGGYHHGGYHQGGNHYGGFYYPYHGYARYGPYRPGLYAPYGYYRPYYGFGGLGGGFGTGLGLGLGLGLGAGLAGSGLGGYGLGGSGLGGYGLGGYGMYRPYYGGGAVVAPPIVMTPPVAPPFGVAGAPGAIAGTPASAAGTPEPPLAQTPPRPDNAAHLQLLVPTNAEVLFDGGKTTQTGAIREFVSPPLTSGKVFDYAITVRYFNADGKGITDRRLIHVRANDWFRLDFTHPAPPEPLVP